MTNKTYEYSIGESVSILFNSNGYIIKAHGFSRIMWCDSETIDEDLAGKHIDELSEMLEKRAIFADEYIKFEKQVHIPLLKHILKSQIDN